MPAKVYATAKDGRPNFAEFGVATFTQPITVSDDVAAQLEREIAGDPGCADQVEPCAACRWPCAEHEKFRKTWNEQNPDQAHVAHFGHVCAGPAHSGHVGVPGRKDIRIERDASPPVAQVVQQPAVAAEERE